MNAIDCLNRDVPDYYDTMYMDGYTPEQILMAHRKMMREMLIEDEEEQENDFSIVSQVKIKWDFPAMTIETKKRKSAKANRS